MTRPSGFVAAGVGFGVSVLVVGFPAGVVVGAGVGALAWGTRAALAVPWGQRQTAMDPFTVQEPWRTFVFGAQRAQRRFDEAVGRLARGPLQDRLNMLAMRVDAATGEAWRTAQAGQTLSTARRHIDVPALRRQLGELEDLTEAGGNEFDEELDDDPAGIDDHASSRADALRAQLASAERLDRTIEQTRARLSLLDARLGEAVTRAIELSVRADAGDELGNVGADVDELIDEMEALRQALSETGPPELE